MTCDKCNHFKILYEPISRDEFMEWINTIIEESEDDAE